jgi:hypothetical protein
MIRALGYQVFIDRARDPSPLATVTLAKLIAERFRLPAEAISARLAQGRFRVKSGVDLPTAERFAADLEALGAVCSIVDDATNQPVSRARAAAPPVNEEPAPAPHADADDAPSSSPADYQSGLAAAFGGGAAGSQDIGALGDPESGSFSLATIDGADDRDRAPAVAQSFSPPGADEPPLADLFAPPESNEELALGIDTDPVPPMVARAPAAAPPQELLSLLPEGAAPTVPRAPEGNPIQRGRAALAQRPGVRAAVGAMLAMLLGFAVAHVVGVVRESSAFDAPRESTAAAAATYAGTTVGTAAEQAELTAAFQRQRAAQLAIMKDSKQSIAILAGVVWLLVAGGVGFVWWRVIDWDRWA